MAVVGFDNEGAISPSWLNDSAEIFDCVDRVDDFKPNSTSTQVENNPKPPVFSPPRSVLKSLLKKPPPVLTPPTLQCSSGRKPPEISPPVVPKNTGSKLSARSLKGTIPSSEGSVLISSTFFKAINEACDIIQTMPLEKLINCFEAKITGITNLLTARGDHLESSSKPSDERRKPTRRSSVAGTPISHTPSAGNVIGCGYTDSWDDFDLLSEGNASTPNTSAKLAKSATNSLPNLSNPAKQINLNLPPDVEIIARPKPKESKLEADTGEGNVFLPLSRCQSKWGMI